MVLIINRLGICQKVISLNEKCIPMGYHLQGKDIASLFSDSVAELLPSMIERASVSKSPQCIEFPFFYDSLPGERWFVASCFALPGGVDFLWHGKDVTEGKIREIELEMYRDHLEEMVKLRTAREQTINSELRGEIERHKRTAGKLKLARERYDLAIHGARDGIWDWDLTDDSMYFSPQWKELFGFEDDEIPNDIWEWAHRIYPEDCQTILDQFGRILRNGKVNFADEYRMRHNDGLFRWIYIKGAVLRNDQGEAVRMAGTCTDITRRKRMEDISAILLLISNAISTTHDLDELYAAIHAVLQKYIEAKNFYIALVDEKNDRVVFPYFRDERESEYPEVSHFSDSATRSSTVEVIKTGKVIILNTEKQIYSRCIGARAKIWIGIPLRSRDKIIGAMAVQYYTLPAHDTSQDMEVLKAVSAQVALAIERKTTENLLSYQALHDGLTKLPNRVLFYERVGQALLRSQRNRDYHFALVMIDLDRFKAVNDCHGHLVGDLLLQNLAERIGNSLRSIDTLARLGGDEFAILFEEIGTSHKIIYKIKQVQAMLRETVNISGYDIQIDSSMGVILRTGEYVTVEELLRDADIAMYQAKTIGPGKVRVFNKSLHAQTLVTMSLEQDLRHALAENELYLDFQPVVSLPDYSIEGFEALIRWNHPKNGIIPPERFIPIAEDTGLIQDIGLWVLEQACRTQAAWAKDIRNVTMAVNLSAKQLTTPLLLKRVRNILDSSGVRPENIIFEITETGIMEAPGAAMSVLRQIKDLGVGLALDDFGTGYSSLSYLHSFPAEIIKIDRSFVSRIEENEESLEIVRAVVALGKTLHLRIIAEGIESPAQYRILNKMGCDQGQGFLFSKPLSETACRDLLLSTTLPWQCVLGIPRK